MFGQVVSLLLLFVSCNLFAQNNSAVKDSTLSVSTYSAFTGRKVLLSYVEHENNLLKDFYCK